MEEEDYSPKKKKKKGFWTMQKIAFAVIFLIGFAIGAIITNQFIDPTLDSSVSSKNAELLQTNKELDSLNDQYYSCLQTFEIDPIKCVK